MEKGQNTERRRSTAARNSSPAAGRSQTSANGRPRPASALDTSAYSPVRARQIARRRRQRRRRRRRMIAALVAVVLLAGGGAYGARQAWLQKHRQEYAEQGLAYLESQNYAQAITAFDDAIALAHGRIGAFESQMLFTGPRLSTEAEITSQRLRPTRRFTQRMRAMKPARPAFPSVCWRREIMTAQRALA